MFEFTQLPEPAVFVPRRSERLRIKREKKLLQDRLRDEHLRVERLRVTQRRAENIRIRKERAEEQRAKQPPAKQPSAEKSSAEKLVRKRKGSGDLADVTRLTPYASGMKVTPCLCLDVGGALIKLWDLPDTKRQKMA